ncbi:MAG: DNA polymerase domain-containing protein [Candidatus Hodarchaeales archaeon]|jgi:DNA polymerase elongation subunit (family B)
MATFHAWLHDVEATDWGVNTYWITPKSGIKAFLPLNAEFFVAKTDLATRKQILNHPEVEAVEEASKYVSIHDWQPTSVLRVLVNPAKIRTTFEDLRKHWKNDLFNADLSIYQQFSFQTGLFPYVYAKIEVKNGRLQENWRHLEQYLQANYRSVPFRTLWMQPFFQEQNFYRGKIQEIHFRDSLWNEEESPIIIAEKSEAATIRKSIDYLNRLDPDILFTSGGDTFLPILAQHATDQGLGYLQMGRGKRRLWSYVRKQTQARGHSYMSYGRVFYSQHGNYLDGGRHHYDVGNSFMWKEGDIDGIHELVRLGCSDPQRIARGTIGTALTAVQMRTAYQRNILIPGRKADSEDFRPAWTMMSDVGGLVFSPKVGFHRNLVELDFLSMYPSIMVNRNVSPDTINCQCCKGKHQQPVPGTNHHICTQRPGLVSLALRNILDRRAYFKSKRKEHPRYERRQKVLKWLLVTCLEENTIVPVKENDVLKFVRIGKYIDDIIQNKTDTNHICLIGVDKNFKTFFNPIKNFFRVKKDNLQLYRIKLETGREITVTGDHLCYVLKNGRFFEKRADRLKLGEFIPVILRSPLINSSNKIDFVTLMLQNASNTDFEYKQEKKQRSQAWVEDVPVIESGLFQLARKVKPTRNPLLTGKERTSRENVLIQLQKIKQRSQKLSPQDRQLLSFIKKLVTGDIGFAKITDITTTTTEGQNVYCFEVSEAYPGFVAGTGGVFSHNSFGYQGYRNARFGRIEAHEAISAYGREALTVTHQIASEYGLEVVAGIVDSIWLKDPDEEPVDPAIIQKIHKQVEHVTQLPLEHAADYHWLVFLPRRHEPTIGVLNRYFGYKTDGSYKIRGIETRQSSAPAFVKKLQFKLLDVLSSARTREEFKKYSLKAKRIMNLYLADLEAGNIPLKDLLVSIRPSRGPDEYVSNTRQALAARQLAAAGVKVEAGVKLSYLIVDAYHPDPTKRVKVAQLLTGKERYDYEEYRKLCIRAYEGLIPPELSQKDLTITDFLTTS